MTLKYRGEPGQSHRVPPGSSEPREVDLSEVVDAALQARDRVADLALNAAEYRDQAVAAVRRHPVIAVAAALGLGFILGGGLSSRLGLRLVGVAGRLVAAAALRGALQPLLEVERS